MGTLKGTPDSMMRVANQDQSSIYSELHTKLRVAHKDESAIHSEWHTEMRLAHQYESAFCSQFKMTRIEEVYPYKIGTMKNVQVLGKSNQDVSSKSRLPMSVALQEYVQEDSDDENDEVEDEENVKNDEEVKDDVYDDDDVCDSMVKDVSSSYNSPDVNNHDRFKTSVEGEVEEEPGGNVSARSRSPRFRQSKA